MWLRSGPSLNYSRVAVVYEGTNLNYRGSSSVDGRGVRWYNVTYNGQSAWISSRYANCPDGKFHEYPLRAWAASCIIDTIAARAAN